MNVVLIDYGAGNLTSVRRGFEAVGADVRVATEPSALARASGIVVPGVGNFSATSSLGDEWREAITRRTAAGVPLLGICLGMQWLFDASEEAPGLPGLGLFAGCCVRMGTRPPLKVPHVGWNTLSVARPSSVLDGVADGASVYFTHSFAAPMTGDAVASTEHGCTFAAAVERANVSGVQFHPEKSGETGRRILRNFTMQARC